MASMEAAADEERRLVMEMLEEAALKKKQRQYGRPASPSTSPRSPARSMFSIASSSPPVSHRPAVRSMFDMEAGPPRSARRSMLDVIDEPKSPRSLSVAESSRGSVAEPPARPQVVRSSTDSNRPSSIDLGTRGHPHAPADHISEYQFSDIYTNNVGNAKPKRNTQGGYRGTSLLSEGLRASEQAPASPNINPDHQYQPPRHNSGSAAPSLRTKSKSPHRLNRSVSPGTKIMPTSVGKASPIVQGILTLDSGQRVVTNKAYTILSDANLAKSGIVLGSKMASAAADGEGPLEKTYMSPDGDVILTDSSDADEEGSSEDEHRGRKKTPRSLDRENDAKDRKGSTEKRVPSGHSLSPESQRKPQSLLAAAEEERLDYSGQQAHQKQQNQSKRTLLEPTITVTTPYGDRHRSPRGARAGSVHPATAYDEGGSGVATPVDSDTEDIKRAQNLSFSQTGIISQPESHRTIRIVYRGEYGRIQQEAKEDNRRLRKYVVASDLSDESTHALEWAVGTVLRDGDTLIAICCIDEESGIVSGDSALVPDEPRAIKEQAVAIREVTASGKIPGSSPAPSFRPSPSPQVHPVDISRPSTAPTPAPTGSAAEMERNKVVELVTEKITKLLRRTQLQVRVIIEVLHCKNPKHLITEVIDLIDPTLVILGSRGRSALKGVILGSFSNYLVTKSSVPVMVARKKLRKTSKYKKAPVRQVNNLEDPTTRSLTAARVD
ncbi:Universal stress protein family [Zalerion maritima]|uniref:Universal stress protein family n=1 Tax=Zalerion maritima TaxID=339359 RepID=A0AAD5RZ19_9PEZI|nr:Universal stress protein family [Zalerion maritima]